MHPDQRFLRHEVDGLPRLLRPEEVAALLRTTRKAIYGMAERGAIPGIRRVGRRMLFVRDELLRWLDVECAAPPPPSSGGGTVLPFRNEVRAPSPEEDER